MKTVDYDKIIRQYYNPDSELYALLIAHSRTVADRALEIAKKCSSNFALDFDFIEQAAMLHDIGIIHCDAPSILCFGTFSYICHGYLGADMLRAEGYPIHALVCERHTGTGLSLAEIEKQNLPIPKRDMRPQTMEEQIICFADLFFSKMRPTEETSIEKIREKLQKYDNNGVEQFNKWCEMFLK